MRRASRVTSIVCVSCTLAYRATSTPYPCARDSSVFIEKIGQIGVCEYHEENTCVSCLQQERYVRGPGNTTVSTNDLNLAPALEHDVDEYDEERTTDSQICYHCRTTALDAAIRRHLRSCARSGGVMRGDHVDFSAFPEYQDYVVYGHGNARYLAELIVSRWALMTQARYIELAKYGRELQTREYHERFNFHGGYMPEQVVETQERWALSRNLEPYNTIDPTRDEELRRRMYSHWAWDLKTRGTEVLQDEAAEEREAGLNDKVRSSQGARS
jgi:hypothetical protein